MIVHTKKKFNKLDFIFAQFQDGAAVASGHRGGAWRKASQRRVSQMFSDLRQTTSVGMRGRKVSRSRPRGNQLQGGAHGNRAETKVGWNVWLNAKQK